MYAIEEYKAVLFLIKRETPARPFPAFPEKCERERGGDERKRERGEVLAQYLGNEMGRKPVCSRLVNWWGMGLNIISSYTASFLFDIA